MNKIIYLFLLTTAIACRNENPKENSPCDCDLLNEKEKYFIKSGTLVESNSNSKAIKEGKQANIELSLEGSPKEIMEKIGKINLSGKFEVPLIDFEKYHYEYQLERDETDYDKNMLLYFLSYCSFYSIFHKKELNCQPDSNWSKKIEQLRNSYLKPLDNENLENNNQYNNNIKTGPVRTFNNFNQPKDKIIIKN